MSVLDWIRNQKTPSDLGRIVSNVAKFTPFAATAGVYDAYTNKKQIGDFYNEQVKPTIDKAPGFIQDFQPDRSFQYKPQDIAKGPVNIPLATVQRGLDTSKSGRDLKRGFDSFFQSSPQWAGGLLKSQYEQDPTRLPMLPGVPQSMASVKNPFISQGQEQRLKGIQGNVVGGINTVQQKNAEYIAKSDLSKQESRNDLAKNVGQGGASLVTAAGITLLSKNPQVGTSLAGLAFGGMKKGQVYDEARAAGLSPEQSDMVSTAAGATEALLEKVGMDIFLNRFGTSSGISNFVANSIIKATSEGLQEGLQEFGSNAWAKLTYDQQRSLLDGVFESAFIGAILGGAGGGSASSMNQQLYQKALQSKMPKSQARAWADIYTDKLANGLKDIQPGLTTKDVSGDKNVGKVDVGKISLPQKQDGFDGYIGKKGERIKIGTAKEMSRYRPEEFAAMVMAGELKRVTPKTEPKTTKDIRITDTKEAKPTKQPTIETVEPATTKLTLREKARDTLLAKTHIEPLMTVRKKQGEKVAADIIKAIHNPDKQAHLFDQQTLAESEQTFEELKQEYNKMTPQDREDIMMSRGKPATKEGQAIQRDAIARLKAKGIDPKSIEVDEVSKYVGTRLSKISDVELLEDYVYGTYKFTKSLKEYIQRYKNTTEKYTKKKFFVAPADAKAAGLELKDNNPVVNLESELMAIAAREGMINLKNDLENNSDGTYIMDADKAPLDWQEIHDPVFNGKRVAPEIAAVTNELISTNKTSQNKALKGVRVTNNLVRTTKFAGSGFHLGVEATQGLADIGLKDGLTGKQIGQITKWSSKQWDKQRKEDFYTRVVGNGGGDSYSIDVQAQTAFKRVVDKMMNTQGAGHLMKVPGVAFKVPSGFINWMFKTYIPMLKYAKVKQETAVLERKTGREISDPELQNIVREGQNFYGEMNERMFGRGATATSVLRFLFLAPGFAEGNIRTIIKGGTQKSAKRSRRNMLTSLMLHAIAGTVGTMAMTGKAPEPPEDLEDMRDLFKVDTGKVDDKGRKIMIDLLTYDKDYWEFTLGLFDEGLANMPKNTVDKVISRLNGMKAPMVDVGLDMAKLLTGEALVDWKGDRVYKVSDPLTQKILKTAVHEWDNVAPIALGTYQSARDKDASVLVATIEAFTGVRPAKTEKDKREQETLGKYWDLKDEQDELYYELYSSKTPQKDIEQYNGALDKLLESKLLDGDTRKDIEDSKIDVKEYWGNKLEMLTNENATQEDIDKVMKLKDNFDYSEQDVLNAFDDYLTQKREKGTAKNPSYSPDVGLEMDREDRLISLMGNGGQQSSVISDTLTDPLSSYNTSIQSKQFTADKYDLTQAKDVNGLVDLYTGRNEQLTAQMNAMDPIRDKADIISTQTLIKKNLASIAKLKANGLGGSGSSRAKRTLKVSGSSGNTNAISGQEKVSLSFKGLGGQSGKTATPKKRSGRL